MHRIPNLLAVALLAGASASAADNAFHWPGGKKAAVVLTYDDALRSHLDIAIPQLNEVELKGTFFLTGTFAPEDVERWRAASAAGHELGNHSVFHPCPAAAYAMEAQYHSERHSVAGMLREIGAMNTFLTAIDGLRARTYGVPCSQTVVGGKDYTEALRASRLVRYVRTGGGDDVITDPAKLDPFYVGSRAFGPQNKAADLIAFAERALQSGGLAVIMFHGVGGDYLNVSAEAHRALLRYLKQHESEIWTGTFQQVMDAATADGR